MEGNETKTWPICNGCDAEIISAMPEYKPWTVLVRDPYGREHAGGSFCLGCMIEFAKHGLQLEGQAARALIEKEKSDPRRRTIEVTFAPQSRCVMQLNFAKEHLSAVVAYCDQVYTEPDGQLSLRFPVSPQMSWRELP